MKMSCKTGIPVNMESYKYNDIVDLLKSDGLITYGLAWKQDDYRGERIRICMSRGDVDIYRHHTGKSALSYSFDIRIVHSHYKKTRDIFRETIMDTLQENYDAPNEKKLREDVSGEQHQIKLFGVKYPLDGAHEWHTGNMIVDAKRRHKPNIKTVGFKNLNEADTIECIYALANIPVQGDLAKPPKRGEILPHRLQKKSAGASRS